MREGKIQVRLGKKCFHDVTKYAANERRIRHTKHRSLRSCIQIQKISIIKVFVVIECRCVFKLVRVVSFVFFHKYIYLLFIYNWIFVNWIFVNCIFVNCIFVNCIFVNRIFAPWIIAKKIWNYFLKGTTIISRKKIFM